jgi:hypothetical protein
MTQLAARLGYWSAIAQTIAGYAYLAAYVSFMLVFPVTTWVDIRTFAAQLTPSYLAALTGIQLLACLQALFALIIFIVIDEFAPPDKKILTRIGIAFALAFMIVASSHYYAQWAAVWPSIMKDDLEGLGMFAQFNFDSPLSAINILSWTFFFGIANLAIAPVFGKSRIEKWIKWGFICNGASGIITSIFFAAGAKWIMLVWVMVISVTWYVYPLLAILFRREERRLAAR